MKISNTEFTRIMDAIACAATRIIYSMTDEEPEVEYINDITREIGTDYLASIGITSVYDDDDDDDEDFNDDVDESNYNPYMGQDEYETYDYESWCDEF